MRTDEWTLTDAAPEDNTLTDKQYILTIKQGNIEMRVLLKNY